MKTYTVGRVTTVELSQRELEDISNNIELSTDFINHKKEKEMVIVTLREVKKSDD